jgi:hypothetical protein
MLAGNCTPSPVKAFRSTDQTSAQNPHTLDFPSLQVAQLFFIAPLHSVASCATVHPCHEEARRADLAGNGE